MFALLAAEGATTAVSVPDVLLDLFVVLVAAKIGAELAERFGVPAVVGEILAGIAIGPSALGLVGDSDVIHFLAELGVIMLLLEVGMEMDLRELAAVGRSSLQVAFAGVAMPFATGAGVMLAFGKSGNTALFVGAALTATSVGITARVFGDMRALATPEARTVLGAAVADDVLGLVILTVVVRIVSEGTVSLGTVANVAGVAVLFLFGVGAIGVFAAPRLFAEIQRFTRGNETVFTLAIAFALLIAVLADEAKLAPIVGAFVAGLALGRTKQVDRIRRDLTPLIHILVPIFFVRIGIDSDISEFKRPAVLGLAGCLVAVGVLGKIAAGWFATASSGDRLLIGLGMIPRGEVGLIFAGIGLTEGVLTNDLYAALLVVVLVTTLVTPPILKVRYTRLDRGHTYGPADATPPEGGWLQTKSGVADLAGTPPQDLGLVIALTAARNVEDVQPGPALLGWLTDLSDQAFGWDRESAELLFGLLRDGGPRAWRFLYTTGVLERALPELADAIATRRADPYMADPTGELQWQLVDAMHAFLASAPDPVARHIRHPEWLVLAALVLEVTSGDVHAAIAVEQQITPRLDLPLDASEEIGLLIADHGLLLAASRRVDAFTESSVEQLAIRLRHREFAAALYALTLVYFEVEQIDRQRLAQLWTLLDAMLATYESGAPELGNILQHRRDQALEFVGENPLARRRINTGPMAWLLSAPPEVLARQALEIYPVPEQRDLRVFVIRDESTVDVVCRDRTGLLAAVTAALESFGIDIASAIAATWPDDMALSSFRVRNLEDNLDAEELQGRIADYFNTPTQTSGIDGVAITADNQASPWYTILTVEAGDRPGLLHAITAAIAVSDGTIHSARVATTPEGKALDTFDLTDRSSAKLTQDSIDAIESAIRNGVAPVRPSRRSMFLRAARGAW
jgi:Kef-type K+ transport system membrane component KefB/predicted amino acid-binding ACT domain protein